MSVVINGGGMLGSILALMLARLTKGNLEITLIEQYSPYSCNISLNMKKPQVIALSPGAYSELIQLNISSILSIFSTAIKQLEISTYNGFNTIFIRAQDYQLSELGYVVELHAIRKQLFNLLHEQSIVTMHYPATVQYIKRERFYNTIMLNNGKKIIAKLMVVADGECNSVLLNNCGIQWFQRNYKQIAVTTTVTTEIPHFGKAFELFTEFGSLALLPMTNNLSFLVWCVSNIKQKEILRWDKNKFSRELQNIFGWKLGKIINVKKRYFYDLCLKYAKYRISHRLVLIGNAAQILHPIAGQGFNLGMRDVITLVKTIFQVFSDNGDIGEYSVLNLYQKSRKLDQYSIIAVTDGLVRLFSSDCVPLTMVRNLGLLCIDNSSFLKRLLVNSILFWKTN